MLLTQVLLNTSVYNTCQLTLELSVVHFLAVQLLKDISPEHTVVVLLCLFSVCNYHYYAN